MRDKDKSVTTPPEAETGTPPQTTASRQPNPGGRRRTTWWEKKMRDVSGWLNATSHTGHNSNSITTTVATQMLG